jgi:hypothetical protein
MNKKIEKTRESIKKAEKQMKELDGYIKTQRTLERQQVDEEIVKRVREVAGSSNDPIEVMERLLSYTYVLTDDNDNHSDNNSYKNNSQIPAKN